DHKVVRGQLRLHQRRLLATIEPGRLRAAAIDPLLGRSRLVGRPVRLTLPMLPNMALDCPDRAAQALRVAFRPLRPRGQPGLPEDRLSVSATLAEERLHPGQV